ncbi:hypothetical protein LCGC14_1751750, partial [marine sediment metagenome]
RETIRIFHCGLLVVIIKERGCFATQKTLFTQSRKGNSEEINEI